MILDTSAMVAILYDEPEKALFVRRIHDADYCRISVANFVETAMVVEKQLGPATASYLQTFFNRAGILVEPVSIEHGELACQAFLRYGKGRHPAGLNFGDCFSYALAKSRDEPLLFKGNDFARTDILSAS